MTSYGHVTLSLNQSSLIALIISLRRGQPGAVVVFSLAFPPKYANEGEAAHLHAAITLIVLIQPNQLSRHQLATLCTASISGRNQIIRLNINLIELN